MARILRIKLHDGTQFELPVGDPEENKPVLKLDGQGWTRVNGTDGQVFVCHHSTIAYAHVRKA